MGTKDTSLNELGEMLTHVVEHMVTKDEVRAIVRDDVRPIVKEEISAAKLATKGDLTAVAEQVASIEHDLRLMRRELNDLAEKVDNISGYRKEIDHALDRIAAIERRLGIGRKFAA